MKQHERTHKNNRLDSVSSAVGSKSSSSTSTGSRSRHQTLTDGSRTASVAPDNSSAMDIDYQAGRRPDGMSSMPRADLSDAMIGGTSGRSEEDGEGESPGLDALATAATEMVDA